MSQLSLDGVPECFRQILYNFPLTRLRWTVVVKYFHTNP